MAAIAIALSLVTATVLWASTIDPIAVGSTGFAPYWTDDGAVVERRYDAAPIDGTGFTYYAAVERVGAPLTFAISIRNDGPAPITIRSVGGSEGGIVEMHAVAADTDPMAGKISGRPPIGGVNGGIAPFAPFGLAPDAEAIVYLEATMTECNARGIVTTLAEVPIDYTVFGVPRSVGFIPDLQIGLRGSGCRG